MALTTVSAVQAIIDYDTTLLTSITSFITDAADLVEEIIGDAISDTMKEKVERYLAAHFIAITDPRVETEQVKTLRVTYQVKLSEGLGITHYGTLAMSFDTSGKLAAWNQNVIKGTKQTPSVTWLGTDLESLTDENNF